MRSSPAMRIRLRLRPFLWAWAGVLLAALPCRGQADKALVEGGKKATAYVRVETAKSVSSGSAFCIDSTGAAGLFVTNHHVIKDAGKGDKITVVLAPGTPGERRLEATRGQG